MEELKAFVIDKKFVVGLIVGLYWVRCIIILHSKIILNIYLTSRL